MYGAKVKSIDPLLDILDLPLEIVELEGHPRKKEPFTTRREIRASGSELRRACATSAMVVA